MEKNPKISVVMPTYNAEKYLREAIDSILNQTYSDFEFLIIDDNSTDKTLEIIESYNDSRIRVIKGDCKGIAAALNKGLEEAKGEYIARMDADDISVPERFEVQVDFMEKHPDVGVCASAYKRFGSLPKGMPEISGYFKNKKFKVFEIGILDFLRTCPICHPTVFFNKSLFERYGLKYNEIYTVSEDQELWFRAVMCFKIFFINKILLKYRYHDNKASLNRRKGEKLALEKKVNLLKKIIPGASIDIGNTTYKQFEKKVSKINKCILKQFPKKTKKSISIAYEHKHKVVSILGLKFKYKMEPREYFYDLINRAKNVKNIVIDKDTLITTPIKQGDYRIVTFQWIFKSQLQHYEEQIGAPDYIALWGTRFGKTHFDCLIKVGINTPLIILEDGFLKCIASPHDPNEDIDYRINLSYTINSKIAYFDATAPSYLENMLNDKKLVITDEQKQRARSAMDKIVENHLTKYNHQPIFEPKIGREGVKKVLVIDQSYGDMAIKKGCANDNTFKKMLECAIKENPDADIIVKTHPDILSGKAKGYFGGVKREGNVYPYTEAINPISLIKYCDEVYVCTSQMGFEALMCGKKVHVFGVSFYSNYGLTDDRQKCRRRKVKRSIEEMFYIIYIMFSHYANPDKQSRCEIEDVIDYIIKKRVEYFSLKGIPLEISSK